MNKNDTDTILGELRESLDKGDILEIHIVKDQEEGKVSPPEILYILLNEWKRIMMVTLIFALVGTAFGYIYNKSVQEKVVSSADMFIIEKIDIKDDYTTTLNKIDILNANINIYLNAILDSVKNSQYKQQKSDLAYLNKLKDKVKENYAEHFVLARYIDNLYDPLSETDNKIVVMKLEIQQRNYDNEIQALDAEISYLQKITSAGATLDGVATDAAIATGVNKARTLASYKTLSRKNTELIGKYSGAMPAQEIVDRQNQMKQLIFQGWSEYEDLSKEINIFAQDYVVKNHVILKESKSIDGAGIAVYKVNLEKTSQMMSDSQRVLRIVILFIIIGVGIGCLWVLRKDKDMPLGRDN